MIYGIGTDVCSIARMDAAVQRNGDRFAQRVLGAVELAEYERRMSKVHQRGINYLATRFAAKEAFSKSIGLGIHSPMRWRDCEILKLPAGSRSSCCMTRSKTGARPVRCGFWSRFPMRLIPRWPWL
jgi:phosphopantethiene--protein transferase domain